MNGALNYALRLLAKKDYTVAELRRKFKVREIDREEAETALLFLKEKKFLDDARYASLYLKSHPSRGKIRIQAELSRKGVSAEIIESVVRKSDFNAELENARLVAKDWLAKKRQKYPDQFKLKQNLIAKLVRQGFSYDLICQVIEDLFE